MFSIYVIFDKDDYINSLNQRLEAIIVRTAFFLITGSLDIKPNVVKIYMIYQDHNMINELKIPKIGILIKARERTE